MSTLIYMSDTMVNVVSADMLDSDVPSTIVVTSMPRADYDASYTLRRKRDVLEQERQLVQRRNSRRDKRAISTDQLPPGYKWGNLCSKIPAFQILAHPFIFLPLVFSDGLRDARDGPQLAIKQEFFSAQTTSPLHGFKLILNITNEVFNGRKYTTAYGTSQLNVFVNDPPQNGTCEIRKKEVNAQGQEAWVIAETGTGLLDKFLITCKDWVDPNGHVVNKYIFKRKRGRVPCGTLGVAR